MFPPCPSPNPIQILLYHPLPPWARCYEGAVFPPAHCRHYSSTIFLSSYYLHKARYSAKKSIEHSCWTGLSNRPSRAYIGNGEILDFSSLFFHPSISYLVDRRMGNNSKEMAQQGRRGVYTCGKTICEKPITSSDREKTTR